MSERKVRLEIKKTGRNYVGCIEKVDLNAQKARTSYMCAASICQYIGSDRLFERNEVATG